MNRFEDDLTVNKELVIYSESTPHCKEHGAMNLLNGYWRCFSIYCGSPSGTYPQGVIPFKFKDRVCNAAITDEEWRNQ